MPTINRAIPNAALVTINLPGTLNTCVILNTEAAAGLWIDVYFNAATDRANFVRLQPGDTLTLDPSDTSIDDLSGKISTNLIAIAGQAVGPVAVQILYTVKTRTRDLVQM
jgi:hypothetical protein